MPNRLGWEAADRPIDVVHALFECNPFSLEPFCNCPCHVASGEWVEDNVSWLRQKLDEEFGNFPREAGWMDVVADVPTIHLIAIHGTSIGYLDQIRWYSATIVHDKPVAHNMP
jgi:hypothetical protein